MSKFKKHKKIYYIPGILSLLVIPLVFWFYGSNHIEENDFRVIGFNAPEKDYFKNNPQYNYKIGYSYNEIEVPVNFSEKIEKEYFSSIKELQNNNMDKTGIKFQLSSNHTYGDFIKLLNLMKKTEQNVYTLDLEDDNFYVIRQEVPNNLKELPIITCGLAYYDDRSTFQIIKTEVGEFIQKIPKYFYPILIGYLILMICAIFRPRIFIPL